MFDGAYLTANDNDIKRKLIAYEEALTVALGSIDRRGHAPEITVCIMSGLPTADASAASPLERMQDLVDRTTNLDVILAVEINGFDEPLQLQNLLGDPVLLVPLHEKNFNFGVAVMRLELEFNASGHLVAHTHERVALNCNVSENPGAQAELAAIYNSTDSKLDEPVATAADTITFAKFIKGTCTTFPDGAALCGCRVAQCAMGALAADSVLWLSGADLAIMNAGGIKSSIEKGRISRRQITIAFPFFNKAALLHRLTGRQILDTLQTSISKLDEFVNGSEPASGGTGQFAQVSHNIRYYWDFVKPQDSSAGRAWDSTANPNNNNDNGYQGGKVRSVAKIWKLQILQGSDGFVDMDMDQNYSVATNSYLAGGGDGYKIFRAVPQELKTNLGSSVDQAASKWLNFSGNVSNAVFTPPLSRRIIQKAPPPSSTAAPATLATRNMPSDLVTALATLVAFLVVLVAAFVAKRVKKWRADKAPENFEDKISKLRAMFHELNSSDHELAWRVPEEIDPSSLTILDKLGSGVGGDVCAGLLNVRIATGTKAEFKVAIKLPHEGSEESHRQALLDEALLLTQFNHRNVINCLGVVTRQHECKVVLPFCGRGALDALLKKRTRLDIFRLAQHVVEGMEYLSLRNFVHRDIASRNVLVSEDNIAKVRTLHSWARLLLVLVSCWLCPKAFAPDLS